MNKNTKNKLRKKMSQAVGEGKGIPEIAEVVKEVFKEATTSRAVKIARTEVMTATNEAALEAYKQSKVVIGKQWLTGMDEKVCPWCSRMENKDGIGVTLPLNDNFFERGESFVGTDGTPMNLDYKAIKAPPLHPNCRCTLLALVRKS